MKRTALKPNMTVAVKTWGNNFDKARVVDTGKWADRRAWGRPEPRMEVLEDGNEYDTRLLTRTSTGASKVLVEVTVNRFGNETKELKAVTLASILGEYDVVAAADAAARKQADERAAAADAARATKRERGAALVERLAAAGISVYPQYDGTIRLTHDQIEALLDKAGQ